LARHSNIFEPICWYHRGGKNPALAPGITYWFEAGEMAMNDEVSEADLLRAKLNSETAVIGWMELQRHHAAGKVIQVGSALDLVDVAVQLAMDNGAKIESWIKSGDIEVVRDTQAAAWVVVNQPLWAIVVSPWVLVQHKVE
jgi:hypothetical protein